MTEDRINLLRRAQQGDREAMERLVSENTGLILSVTKRLYGRGVEPEDLFQLGCIGFLKAVSGFDLEYGTQFSTYAVPKIAGEIRRFLRDDGTIKVSRTLKERSAAIKAERSRLYEALGRDPTVGELSSVLQLTPEEIAGAELSTAPTESLQRVCSDSGLTIEESIGGEDEEEQTLDRVCLRDAIGRLPEPERRVILLRYFHDLTQEKAARLLGVSQVQISRIERRAILALRTDFSASE